MIVCMVKILEIFKGDLIMEKKELKFDFVFCPIELTDFFTCSGDYEIAVKSIEGCDRQILKRVGINQDKKKDKSAEQPEDKE